MMELTEFLLARIAEDERHARKLAETDRRPVLSLATTVNHPRRILAECDAKRRIVEECNEGAWKMVMAYQIDPPGWPETAEAVLLNMAAVYADHPDYDDEWKP